MKDLHERENELHEAHMKECNARLAVMAASTFMWVCVGVLALALVIKVVMS